MKEFVKAVKIETRQTRSSSKGKLKEIKGNSKDKKIKKSLDKMKELLKSVAKRVIDKKPTPKISITIPKTSIKEIKESPRPVKKTVKPAKHIGESKSKLSPKKAKVPDQKAVKPVKKEHEKAASPEKIKPEPKRETKRKPAKRNEDYDSLSESSQSDSDSSRSSISSVYSVSSQNNRRGSSV